MSQKDIGGRSKFYSGRRRGQPNETLKTAVLSGGGGDHSKDTYVRLGVEEDKSGSETLYVGLLNPYKLNPADDTPCVGCTCPDPVPFGLDAWEGINEDCECYGHTPGPFSAYVETPALCPEPTAIRSPSRSFLFFKLFDTTVSYDPADPIHVSLPLNIQASKIASAKLILTVKANFSWPNYTGPVGDGLPDGVTGHGIDVLLGSIQMQPNGIWDTSISDADATNIPGPNMFVAGNLGSIRFNTGFEQHEVTNIIADDSADELSSLGGLYQSAAPTGTKFVGGTVVADDKVEIDVTQIVKYVCGLTQGNIEGITNLLVKGRSFPVYDGLNPTCYGYFGETGNSESYLIQTPDSGSETSPPALAFHSMDAAEVEAVTQAVVETRHSIGRIVTRNAVPPTLAFSSTTSASNQYLTVESPPASPARVPRPDDFFSGIVINDEFQITNAYAVVVVDGLSQTITANGTHTFKGVRNNQLLVQTGATTPLFTFVTGPDAGEGYDGIVSGTNFTTVPQFTRTTDTSVGDHNILVNMVVTTSSGSTSLEDRGVARGSWLRLESAANSGIFKVIDVDYSDPSVEYVYVDAVLVLENSNEDGTTMLIGFLDDAPKLVIEYFE